MIIRSLWGHSHSTQKNGLLGISRGGEGAPPPVPDYALSFDGGDRMVVADNAALDQAHFKFEFWIKFESEFTGGAQDLWVMHRDPPYQCFFHTGGSLRFAVNDGSSWREIASTTTTWAADTWYHVSLNVTPGGDQNTGQLNIYINGTREATGFIEAVGSAASTQDLTIGSRNDGSQGIVAIIDEILMSSDYHDGSLTSITVPTAKYVPDENTVFLFHLDEGEGLTADNAEGTAALDATLAGSTATPTWVTGRF